jgi:hypothetical protein
VSIACLDDLTPAEMAALPVQHMDGAGNIGGIRLR